MPNEKVVEVKNIVEPLSNITENARSEPVKAVAKSNKWVLPLIIVGVTLCACTFCGGTGVYLYLSSYKSNPDPYDIDLNFPTVTPSVTTIVTPTVTPSDTPTPTPSIGFRIPNIDKIKPIKGVILTSDLTITSPVENRELDGKFTVAGKAKPTLGDLMIQVWDTNGYLLTQKIINQTGSGTTLQSYSTEVQIEMSPSSSNGYVYVFPYLEGIDSSDAVSVEFIFSTLEVPDRIILYLPVSNQEYDGGDIEFRGLMKGFFEGTMGLRLIGGNGGTLYTTTIMASGDNYTDFAEFNQTVNVGEIPSTSGSNAHWELFETSMKDGTITVLLEVPVTI